MGLMLIYTKRQLIAGTGKAQSVQWLRYGQSHWQIGFRFPAAAWEILLVAKAPRPALRPTQPPIQSVYGAVSPKTNRRRRKAGHLPPPTAVVLNAFRCIVAATPPSPPHNDFKTLALKRCRKNLQLIFTAAVLDNSVNIHQWFLIRLMNILLEVGLVIS